MVRICCFLSWGKPGDSSHGVGEDSWKKDLRGCEGQREDVEVEPWFTQELGTAPRRKEFQKKRIYFYLIRIPLHCMSNVWRKDRRETEKQKDCAFLSCSLLGSWNTLEWELDTESEKLGFKTCTLTFISCGKKSLNIFTTSLLICKIWLITSNWTIVMKIKWDNRHENV